MTIFHPHGVFSKLFKFDLASLTYFFVFTSYLVCTSGIYYDVIVKPLSSGTSWDTLTGFLMHLSSFEQYSWYS